MSLTLPEDNEKTDTEFDEEFRYRSQKRSKQ